MHLLRTALVLALCSCQLDPHEAQAVLPLERSAHPLAKPELDRGPLDPSHRLTSLSLVFKLSPEQERARDALLAAPAEPGLARLPALADSGSIRAALSGAKDDVVARARTWLASQGLEVHGLSPLGTRVTFSGTAARVQAAFHTELRRYEVAGAQHFAMNAPPQVPADLAPTILALHGAHDFVARPQYTTGGKTAFAPPDWANVYDAASLHTTGVGATSPIEGAGVTIAVVGVADFADTDVAAYRLKFAFSAMSITKTLVPNTGTSAAGNGGPGLEAIGDVEWTTGAAPLATINYVYTGADDPNVDDAIDYAIENNLGDVLSTSWAECEASVSAADQDVAAVYASAANAMGITFVAAMGDNGAAGCLPDGISGLYPSLPASSPNVTAVGGSEFSTGSVSGSPYFTGWSNTEHVWNESSMAGNVEATGGGISTIFSRPAYQASVPTCAMVGSLPLNTNAANMRMVPDVVLTAGHGRGGTVPKASSSARSRRRDERLQYERGHAQLLRRRGNLVLCARFRRRGGAAGREGRAPIG